MKRDEFVYQFELHELGISLRDLKQMGVDPSCLATKAPFSKPPSPKPKIVAPGQEAPNHYVDRSIPNSPPRCGVGQAELDAAMSDYTLENPAESTGQQLSRAEHPPQPTKARRRELSDLLVSVHALGQYEFCPRAAIIAHETGDQSEPEIPAVRLGYMPSYELERIEEQLAKYGWQFAALTVFACGMTYPMYVSVSAEDRMLFYPASFVFLIAVYVMLHLVARILPLLRDRSAALRAAPQEPDPFFETIQSVNWWSMLKSGFEPVAYEIPFRHRELPLEGVPWRVFERGSIRIPVIRSGAIKLGERPNQIYPKHLIRAAAYAALLESIPYVEVPFAIVLPSKSYYGLAVPITDAMRQMMVGRLSQFLETIRCSQSGLGEPRPPSNKSRCLKCPLGLPEPLNYKEMIAANTKSRRLLVLEHISGRKGHCVCGDRFGSAPPHEKMSQFRLAPITTQ